jgi:hypothetical protein
MRAAPIPLVLMRWPDAQGSDGDHSLAVEIAARAEDVVNQCLVD